MVIGVPREIKECEYRVAIVPAGVKQLVSAGHQVLLESGAGDGTMIDDSAYIAAGAEIVQTPEEIFQRSEIVVKVKEPQPSEYSFIRPKQIIFGYFHFAASRELTEAMLKTGCICLAYETIQNANGATPLLTPMSEVAGRMSIQAGMQSLERPEGGRGILLAGVPGVTPAQVVILGAGTVGTNAAILAAGLGASVTLMDVNMERLRYLDHILPKNVVTLFSNAQNIQTKISEADLVIGAIYLRGAKTPVLVTKNLISSMKHGAVVVDVAVDQGGCIETIQPTTHKNPTYSVDGVIHYGVSNMPGIVPCTSTYALTNETLPYILKLADLELGRAIRAILENPDILSGVNIFEGNITLRAIADEFGLSYASPETTIH